MTLQTCGICLLGKFRMNFIIICDHDVKFSWIMGYKQLLCICIVGLFDIRFKNFQLHALGDLIDNHIHARNTQLARHLDGNAGALKVLLVGTHDEHQDIRDGDREDRLPGEHAREPALVLGRRSRVHQVRSRHVGVDEHGHVEAGVGRGAQRLRKGRRGHGAEAEPAERA